MSFLSNDDTFTETSGTFEVTAGNFTSNVTLKSISNRKKVFNKYTKEACFTDTYKEKAMQELKKLGNPRQRRAVIEACLLCIRRVKRTDTQMDFNDEQINYMQFKDGAFDFRTNEVRPRTEQDFVSRCEDFNCPIHLSIEDEEAKDHLKKLIKQVIPSDSQREAFLKTLGMMITGHNKEQRMLFQYDYCKIAIAMVFLYWRKRSIFINI